MKLVSREMRFGIFSSSVVEIQHRADLSGQLGEDREQFGVRGSWSAEGYCAVVLFPPVPKVYFVTQS